MRHLGMFVKSESYIMRSEASGATNEEFWVVIQGENNNAFINPPNDNL
jgi:hypothetical protein